MAMKKVSTIVYESLKLPNLRPALYMLMQKAVILDTCFIVRNCLVEQWISCALSVRPLRLENQINCYEVMNMDDDDDDDDDNDNNNNNTSLPLKKRTKKCLCYKFFPEAIRNTIKSTIFCCQKLPYKLCPGWWENAKAPTFHRTFRTANKQRPHYVTKIRYATPNFMWSPSDHIHFDILRE